MTERVFVTGGDGFLGIHIVYKLLADGYQVRVFSEVGRPTPTLDGTAVEIVRGDLREQSAVTSAVYGSELLIHAAASTSVWPSRSRLLKEINIGGTQNILHAAAVNGVKRIVHVGTASSFTPGTLHDPGTEESPDAATSYRLGYIETKREAQRLVVEEYRRSGLPAIVVAPTFMIGPHDSKPGSGQLIIGLVKQKVPGYTAGGRNYVHVRDVADGIVAALDRGRIGDSYILGNRNLSYREFFDIVSDLSGVKAPSIRFPSPLAIVAGFFGSLSGSILRRQPTLTLPMARISVEANYYSAAKAIRELGLPQTPIEIAVEEALRWFRDNGYII